MQCKKNPTVNFSSQKFAGESESEKKQHLESKKARDLFIKDEFFIYLGVDL